MPSQVLLFFLVGNKQKGLKSAFLKTFGGWFYGTTEENMVDKTTKADRAPEIQAKGTMTQKETNALLDALLDGIKERSCVRKLFGFGESGPSR